MCAEKQGERGRGGGRGHKLGKLAREEREWVGWLKKKKGVIRSRESGREEEEKDSPHTKINKMHSAPFAFSKSKKDFFIFAKPALSTISR